MPKGRKQQRGQSKRSFIAKKQEKAAAQTAAAVPAGKAGGHAAVGSPDLGAAGSAPVPAANAVSATSPIGLVNLGHTCYFNAMLQVCLYARLPAPSLRAVVLGQSPAPLHPVSPSSIWPRSASCPCMATCHSTSDEAGLCMPDRAALIVTITNMQVLLSAPPVQAYFLSPDQLTKKGLFGGAMREVLEASQGDDILDGLGSSCCSVRGRCAPWLC